MQQSLSARPRTLSQLIGQDKMVKGIRGLVADAQKNGGMPKAWLLSGPLGTGKTSTAKILALSYQCQHQNGEWGTPCKECQANYHSFSIHPIPGAAVTGKVELLKYLDGVNYAPFAGSKYRIYIFDEAHRMNVAAQSLGLDLFEETPETTIFIISTTEPHNILETLRSRCMMFSLRELNSDGILLLVNRLLKRLKSPLPADRLTDALVDRGVYYPRLICHSVEKYVGGSSPEEAAVVDVVQEVDTKHLTRAMVKGDWETVSKFLLNAQMVDAKGIRQGVITYLRAILLESPDISEGTRATAKALENICNIQYMSDLAMSAALTSQLYQLCSLFSRYPK